jgi:hypothetical protein
MTRVIYKNSNGTVSILVPTPEILKTKTVDEVAKKDIPKGLKYKIVEDSEISSDRTFRNAWTIDESELTDGVGEKE